MLLLAVMSIPRTTLAAWVEEPAYQVVREGQHFELRQYAALRVVRTETAGDFEAAGQAGFRAFFGYIRGENSTGARISMTAPVLQDRSYSRWAVAFVLPAELRLEQTPYPSASGMQLGTEPAGTFAVSRFFGGWSETRFVERETALRE